LRVMRVMRLLLRVMNESISISEGGRTTKRKKNFAVLVEASYWYFYEYRYV
jgi:hypothetical protein